MGQYFALILNNSVTVSILIAVLLVFRGLCKKISRRMICFLWIVAAIKLIVPIQIESPLGLLPDYTPVPVSTFAEETLADTANTEKVAYPVGEGQTVHPQEADRDSVLSYLDIAAVVWCAGAILMVGYMIVTYIRLKKKVAASIQIEKNVYECDYISGPFVLGIVRPDIYYPSGLTGQEKEYVLKHERMHLKRKDHIWKLAAFLILAIYWFHPLCWISYILFCRDIEYACDEIVTVRKDRQWKADYCQALLNCSASKKIMTVCPVAFGETSVKGRVKSIMNHKKTAFGFVLAAVVLFAGAAVCFATTRGSNIRYDYGSSKLYSKEDMDEAMDVIKKEFSTWEKCELHSIKYTSDQSASEKNLDWMNELGSANGYKEKFTDCIEFYTDFHSPENSEDAGALAPDYEYTNYGWWLARTEGGKWQLLTWGY